jgi:biopolymer transport protein ExbD
MNAAQVRAKARAAMKRREEEIEQEEIEGGEINLIPYLDIVTNLMLFLLASITAGLILGQLNTTLPDRGPSQASMADQEPDKNPDDQPIKLVVSVTKQNILVWSITGKEGTLKQPKATIARVADVGKEKPIPAYDYKALNEALREIAARRWKDRPRAMLHYQAILMADGDIPYGTIIATMDAMRCPPGDPAAGACLFPADKKALDEAQTLVGPPPNDLDSILERTGLFDPDRIKYDPEKHALFHDILFSKGFG